MSQQKKAIFKATLVVFVLATLMGCVAFQVQEQSPGYSTGPPDRGPGYEHRATRHYRYYPDANAYFWPERNLWFVLIDGSWRSQNQPPRGYGNRLDNWTDLELDTDEPYRYNHEHRSQQPGRKPQYDNRQKRRYRYYPDANAYFWPERNLWFVLEDGNWRSQNQPPRGYGNRLDNWTDLELDTDEPYRYNHKHRSQQPDRKPQYDNRQKRRYRYYPDVNVYFEPDRKVWFFPSNGGWKSQRKLPRDYNNRLGKWKDLELDTDEPYKYNREHKGQQPDRAPEYDHRLKRRYRYYPDANVYYEPEQNVWFFPSNGGWKSQKKLPRDYNDRLGDGTDLELDTDRPYQYNRDHVKKFPPRKYRNKKDKWSKDK